MGQWVMQNNGGGGQPALWRAPQSSDESSAIYEFDGLPPGNILTANGIIPGGPSNPVMTGLPPQTPFSGQTAAGSVLSGLAGSVGSSVTLPSGPGGYFTGANAGTNYVNGQVIAPNSDQPWPSQGGGGVGGEDQAAYQEPLTDEELVTTGLAPGSTVADLFALEAGSQEAGYQLWQQQFGGGQPTSNGAVPQAEAGAGAAAMGAPGSIATPPYSGAGYVPDPNNPGWTFNPQGDPNDPNTFHRLTPEEWKAQQRAEVEAKAAQGTATAAEREWLYKQKVDDANRAIQQQLANQSGAYQTGLLGNETQRNTIQARQVDADITATKERLRIAESQGNQDLALRERQRLDSLSIQQQQLSQQASQFGQTFGLQQGTLTGQYGGVPTLAAQNQAQQFGLQQGGLTGIYNGTPTLAAQQQQFGQNMALAGLASNPRDYAAYLYAGGVPGGAGPSTSNLAIGSGQLGGGRVNALGGIASPQSVNTFLQNSPWVKNLWGETAQGQAGMAAPGVSPAGGLQMPGGQGLNFRRWAPEIQNNTEDWQMLQGLASAAGADPNKMLMQFQQAAPKGSLAAPTRYR